MTLYCYIGCIGTLMKGTGLEELLGSAFSGVRNMLNGKAWPKAMRGFRMVAFAVLQEYITTGKTTPEDLQCELEMARSTPTGRIWVDCFLIPTILIHLFIRAEREDDWLLHMYCLRRMLPYFFAAGHWNYARYILWHVIDMESQLPKDAREMILRGQHVCQHGMGVWKSVFSDQFGEQTYIRYGKGKGGLVGMTLYPDQVAGWVLSYPICKFVSLTMDNMFDETLTMYDITQDKHKEEGLQRRQLDADDRQKIQEEFAKCSHPLQTDCDKPINIVNGRIANEKVNVQNTLEIGNKMVANFKDRLPGGFHKPLSKQIYTMEGLKKGINIADKMVYDMEVIYARIIVIGQRRNVSMSEVFSYEMGPMPFSLFDEYGDMRKSNKSVITDILAVHTSESQFPEVMVVDGGALFYHVTWPQGGTVQALADSVVKKMNGDHDVYIVFDRYIKDSLKSHERERRRGGKMMPDYELTYTSILPPRDVIMKNPRNKQILIRLLCGCSVPDNIHMVGEADNLFGHEEADVAIISYVNMIIHDHKDKVQVLADVFVLLMYWFWKHQPPAEITMKRFDGRTISINASAEKLGAKCLELLPLHALTGCDTVSYPFGKGKVTALKMLLNPTCPRLDHVIGEHAASEADILESGGLVFSLLYGAKPGTKMNQIRYDLFKKKKDAPMNIKTLPPTDQSLAYHVKRAHLQALIWKAADQQSPPVVDINQFGWEMKDGTPHPIASNAPPSSSWDHENNSM